MPVQLNIDDPSTLIGRTIIVGMTYLDQKGEVERQVQHFGTITNIVGHDMTIEGPDGKVLHIPYDVRALSVAAKGTYRLRQTQEEIENPDLLATWTIEPKAPSTAVH